MKANNSRNLFGVLIAIFGGTAQALAQIPNATSAADNAWLTVQTLAAPMPLPDVSNVANPALLVIQQANQFELGSEQAKAFFTNFPTDVLASQAKKLEVVLALQGVQLGDTQYQAAALDLASAYLANGQNSAQDRFDVALAMSVLSSSVQGTRLIDDPTAYQAFADSLHVEFGDISPVYNFYVNAVHTASAAGASAIASELLGLNAPSWAKAEAQKALARAALVGKPLDLTLFTVDNKAIDLEAPGSSPTLVYVWSNRTGTGDLAALASFATAVPDGTRVIYVSLQSNLSTAVASESSAPLPGLFCFDAAGLDGLTARVLGVQHFPCIYVVDKEGSLTGFGRPQDAAALLSAANSQSSLQ